MNTRRPVLFLLLASALFAASAAEAVPRIIWRGASDTSAEAGPGKTINLATDTATGVTIFSVHQDTGARTILITRGNSRMSNPIATRRLSYVPATKTLFSAFVIPNRLTAVKPLSRNIQWDVPLRDSTFVGEVAATKEGNAIVPMQGAGVAFLNRNSGRTKWIRTDLNVLTPDAPAIGSGPRVFVHSATSTVGNNRPGNVAALNTRNGRTVWEFATGISRPDSQPVFVPSRNLVIVSGNGIFGINGTTGREVWHRGSGEFGKPVIAKDLAIVTTTRQISGLRLNSGRPKWTRSIDIPTCDPVYTSDGNVVVGTINGNSGAPFLQAFDARTGRLRWRLNLSGVIYDIETKGAGRYFCGVGSINGEGIDEIVAVRD